MVRPKGRTSACDAADARQRLLRAQEFVRVAEFVLGEREQAADGEPGRELNLSDVSAALAVLAGIAASDAATCARMGQRSRGENHREAVDLVRTVNPHGSELAKDLDRLLVLKDSSHYGVLGVSEGQAAKAVGWAKRMIKNAQEVLGG